MATNRTWKLLRNQVSHSNTQNAWGEDYVRSPGSVASSSEIWAARRRLHLATNVSSIFLDVIDAISWVVRGADISSVRTTSTTRTISIWRQKSRLVGSSYWVQGLQPSEKRKLPLGLCLLKWSACCLICVVDPAQYFFVFSFPSYTKVDKVLEARF